MHSLDLAIDNVDLVENVIYARHASIRHPANNNGRVVHSIGDTVAVKAVPIFVMIFGTTGTTMVLIVGGAVWPRAVCLFWAVLLADSALCT